MQANLLAYGLFRWASRGLYLGEQRHYLNVDVDDWFNTADHLLPGRAHRERPRASRCPAHDAYNAAPATAGAARPVPAGRQLHAERWPTTAATPTSAAGTTCSPNGGVDQLTATSRCLPTTSGGSTTRYTHPELNFTDYATSRAEISHNLTIAATSRPAGADHRAQDRRVLGPGRLQPRPERRRRPADRLRPGRLQPAAARTPPGTWACSTCTATCRSPATCRRASTAASCTRWSRASWWCRTGRPTSRTTPRRRPSRPHFYNSYYGPSGRFPYWPQQPDLRPDARLRDRRGAGPRGHRLALRAHLPHRQPARLRRRPDPGDRLAGQAVRQSTATYYAVPLLNPDWPALAGTRPAPHRRTSRR